MIVAEVFRCFPVIPGHCGLRVSQSCDRLAPVNDALREHIEQISGTKSLRSVALAAGITPSTLVRQLDGEMKAATVVAICRAYGAPILPAFVAAGYISPDEARASISEAALRSATDRQLAEEILRRVIEAEGEHPELTDPISDEQTTAAVQLSDRRRRNVGGSLDTLTDEEIAARYGDQIAADRSDPEQDLDDRTP
ncbi:hypothetical protein [Rathayibacter sp. AY2B5]|uniref:hypothetical protein n=1 Tax=Rathayibacter sp. AY2B5 TaxID=2080570 RepID=UPI000CE7DDBE|nr:hypothetical protein [Rathayibacter sp. AY2B5]